MNKQIVSTLIVVVVVLSYEENPIVYHIDDETMNVNVIVND